MNKSTEEKLMNFLLPTSSRRFPKNTLFRAAPAALAVALAACAQHPGTGTTADGVGPDTLNVADAAISGGDPNMALSISQSVLKENPDNVDALVHEGDAYYALDRCLPAQAAYQMALKYDAKSSLAETGIGRCLLKSDPAGAEHAFLAAVAADPGNAAAWSDLGVARDLQGNFEGAVQPYQQSILINPGSTATVVNLGLSLALSGHGQEALQYLGPLAMGQGATPKIREDYAAALIAAGDDEKARSVLAIDLPPDQVQQSMDGFSALIANSIATPASPPRPAATEPVVPTPPIGDAPLAAPVPITPPKPLTTTAPVPLAGNAPQAVVAPASLPALKPSHAAAAPTQQAQPRVLVSNTADSVAVQLGALNSSDAAQRQWSKVSSAAPSLFAGKSPDIQQAEVKGQTYYRLRLEGFGSEVDAARFCGEVSVAGYACTVADF